MKLPRLLTSVAAVAALVGTTYACIEALTLSEMVTRTDQAVHGEITQVRSIRTTIDDTDWPRIFTLITVKGQDLYTGKPAEVEMAFMGGTHNGVTEVCSTMPAASDYRVGNEIVAFSSPIEGWGAVERILYAGYGGIYRVMDTPKGKVVLGRGEDFAIEQNTTLRDLKVGIGQALEAKQEDKR